MLIVEPQNHKEGNDPPNLQDKSQLHLPRVFFTPINWNQGFCTKTKAISS